MEGNLIVTYNESSGNVSQVAIENGVFTGRGNIYMEGSYINA